MADRGEEGAASALAAVSLDAPAVAAPSLPPLPSTRDLHLLLRRQEACVPVRVLHARCALTAAG